MQNENPNPNSARSNEREVTDPITHLPIQIHDSTSIELEQIPPPNSDSKATEGMDKKQVNNQRHVGIEQVVREEMSKGRWEEINSNRTRLAVVAAVSVSIGGYSTLILSKILGRLFGSGGSESSSVVHFIIASLGCTLLAVAAASIVLYHDTTKEETVQGHEKPWTKPSAQEKPESTDWLNSFLDTLWPLVNPALFTAVSDMLEDALQATLPKMIHAVRVADIGQGSEPMRILGIRWLDTADASKTKERDGLVAEEGDFVNFEAAVAYRARTSSTSSLKGRSANLHFLLQFWLAGGIELPVWVEITGIVSTARVRIHLTPNPPFLSTMTLTLLGQPKISLTATPLAKNFLNVMDVPGLSGWLHKSINDAISEYVAPRSLTLDLKTLLMGREKMDTEAHGVVWITIKCAEGFKAGDEIEVWKSRDGRKGDLYVTASWGKWGKPLWSTRIIHQYSHPSWVESTALLVAPAEMHAQERLKLQLWDSDRFTADDNLGTVELPLFDILKSEKTLNRLNHRQDRFLSDDGNSTWPGTLTWSVGYFAKTTLEQHLSSIKDKDDEYINVEKLRHNIETEAKEKLREAETRKQGEEGEKGEIEQQKKEDLKEKTEEIVSGTPPSLEWPAGILSVKIEQISGVEVVDPRQSGTKSTNADDDVEDEEGDDLPSPYCTIIINHSKVYKTRTKMKTNNPYYDAGTERFLKSWPTSLVMIAVRDSRAHEIHPLIGVVVLPLRKLFMERGRSQVTESFPLVGGIGYGRLKCSVMFRSVQIRPEPSIMSPSISPSTAPSSSPSQSTSASPSTSRENIPQEMLGWDLGTLQINPESIRVSGDLPDDLKSTRITFRTLYGRDKVFPDSGGGLSSAHGVSDGTNTAHTYHSKKHRQIHLPIKNRYSSCLLIQFRKTSLGPDKTPAFGTLWLKDVPDVQEVGVRVVVRRNDHKSRAMGRCRGNVFEEGGFEERESGGDIGEKLGELEFRVRFWPGLSGYHHYLADKDSAMADVMEVLDAAESSDEISKSMLYEGEGGDGDDGGSSSSSHDSSDSDSDSGSEDSAEEEEHESTGRVEGIKTTMKDYNRRKGELHRKHRGLMQWSAARKVAWITRGTEAGVEKVKRKVVGRLRNEQKDGIGGVEKEV